MSVPRSMRIIWFYNTVAVDFVKEISELDDLTFDEIMTFNEFNETKLEAIGDWCKNDAIKDRIYKYNISL